MIQRAVTSALLMVVVMAATAPPAAAQQSPPDSPRASEIKALVEKAAALVEKRGKAAFAEFRRPNSEWFHGDTYLFSYDLKGNVLLNPGNPKREGTNPAGEKDKNGKLFHAAIIETAESKGAGWVDYWLPKPGQAQPSQKWSYVKRVTIDGVPGLIAAGFYVE